MRYLKRLQKIYGKGHSRLGFIGSPYEGRGNLNKAELILHELGHRALFPKEKSFAQINQYLDAVSPYLANLHEIKAAAIELLVAQSLNIDIELDGIGWVIAKNMVRPKATEEWVTARVEQAMKMSTIQRKADQIVQHVKAA